MLRHVYGWYSFSSGGQLFGASNPALWVATSGSLVIAGGTPQSITGTPASALWIVTDGRVAETQFARPELVVANASGWEGDPLTTDIGRNIDETFEDLQDADFIITPL